MLNNAPELLKDCKVVVSPETYFLISLNEREWQSLLGDPGLSPRMTSPFMILKDKFEVTLLLDEIDYENCRQAIGDARVEGGFRLLSFDLVLNFDVVGFLAEITRILSESGIPILALSAYSRDHLLVKQENLAKTLKALGTFIDDVC